LQSTASQRLRSNLSELPAAAPVEVFRPGCREEVASIVRGFAGRNPGVTLRAISSGRNWGLGSGSSPSPDTAVMDLSGLRGVRAIDPERGFAVVEAGVTQTRLVEALRGSGRFLNCTASSPETSVLGNMMDRGVGLRRQRTEDLLGLEVVTANGDVDTVGWWPNRHGLAPNRYGLGPSSLGLFPQSNLAIATAAVVKLLATPEETSVVTFAADDERYSEVVDVLRTLVRDDLTRAVVKLYDRGSSSIYGAGDATLLGHVCVDGAREVVETKSELVRQRLAGGGARPLSGDDLDRDPLTRAIRALYRGDVSHSEDVIRATLGTSSDDADTDGRGWIFILPFVPFTGHDLQTALRLVRGVAARTGTEVGTTMNALDSDTVDLVIAIRFDRRSVTAVGEAHRALDELFADLVEHGFSPYRLDTSHARSDVLSADGLESRVAHGVKAALDPHQLFGSTRYLA